MAVTPERTVGILGTGADAADNLATAKQAGGVLGAAPDILLGSAGQTARATIDAGLIARLFAGTSFVRSPKVQRFHPDLSFLFQVGGGPAPPESVSHIGAGQPARTARHHRAVHRPDRARPGQGRGAGSPGTAAFRVPRQGRQGRRSVGHGLVALSRARPGQVVRRRGPSLRTRFPGTLSVQHEDPVWGGDPERVTQGLRLAHRTLSPLVIA